MSTTKKQPRVAIATRHSQRRAVVRAACRSFRCDRTRECEVFLRPVYAIVYALDALSTAFDLGFRPIACSTDAPSLVYDASHWTMPLSPCQRNDLALLKRWRAGDRILAKPCLADQVADLRTDRSADCYGDS